DAFKAGADDVAPVEHPETIAKSLAIGDPGDGFYALRRIRGSGGVAESASDEEILGAIRLLAETEGVFAEPAGGVTIAALKKLVEAGEVPPDEEVVCCVTGSGFKASETLLKRISPPRVIEPSLEALSDLIEGGGTW
ncbi:MAG: pyridoxal-phosphate dependent enzyme, partial [Candidatus Bathyarchaeia archaeon]